VAWNKITGEPIGAMLGWQDRRTSPRLDDFSEAQKASIQVFI
jgi:glycerol kinase